MYPAFIIAVGIWMAAILDGIVAQNRDLAQMYESRLKQLQLVQLAENLEQYIRERGATPASVAALSASAGFEHTRALADNWQGYAVSPTLTDSVWQYSRMVLFSNDPKGGTAVAAYLAANACGSGGYDTASSWCGAKSSQWYRRETKERYTEQLSTQRARMNRLAQKLADYYSNNGKYPDQNAAAVALTTDSIQSLASLAGYAGSARACGGTFAHMGVPVDCADMFDLWGGPVGYQFVSSKGVVLIAESPIFNSSGGRVVVAVDLDNSQL
ncbi:MAG: hypothetical protein D4S02_05975 [Rhodocyclaceae bacterium]|nr:MAG: hypothetical protein D4S02_05975 [Rhodocyclaceae bacterium]